MKYFLDCEFLEGKQNKKLFGVKIGETKPTIDLISIGIVAEDGREFYEVSRDFNIDEAWNRYDLTDSGRSKTYWIRDNVLRPIFDDIWAKNSHKQHLHQIPYKFTLRNFKKLINLYGKSNEIIAVEARNFVMETGIDYGVGEHTYTPIDIYTYYGDYDWVTFCWLYGRMIDLPTGFPMYSRDLKQMLDDKACAYFESLNPDGENLKERLQSFKLHPNYPKQENEHLALHDARWNKKLYEFLQSPEK